MLAALLLHTPVTRREGIALALQVLAIAILVDPFHMTMDPVGVASLLVCVVCYSLYAVGGKKLITDLGSITVTAWSFSGVVSSCCWWPACPTSRLCPNG